MVGRDDVGTGTKRPHKRVTFSRIHGTIVASYNVESFSLERMRGIDKGDVESRFDEFAKMIRLA